MLDLDEVLDVLKLHNEPERKSCIGCGEIFAPDRLTSDAGIGHFKENKDIMMLVVKYILKHRSN